MPLPPLFEFITCQLGAQATALANDGALLPSSSRPSTGAIWQTSPAIKKLEPSFYTGPILTTTQFGVQRALLPPPDVADYAGEFLYEAPNSTAFQSTGVPAAPPLSNLPKSRVLLTEGWLRMVGVKKPS